MKKAKISYRELLAALFIEVGKLNDLGVGCERETLVLLKQFSDVEIRTVLPRKHKAP